MKKLLQRILIILVWAPSLLKAQNPEEIKGFLSRSHTAIFKGQKEIISKPQKSLEQDLLKAILDQASAVKLFNEQKYQEALTFSYQSRLEVVRILETLNPVNADYFNLNEQEKSLLKTTAQHLPKQNDILTKDETTKILNLDLKNSQSLRKLTLSIN